MDVLIKVIEEAIDILQHTYSEMSTNQKYTGLQIEVADDEWQNSDLRTWRAWTGLRRVWGLEHHGDVYDIASIDDCHPYTGRRRCQCNVCQSSVATETKSN